MKKLLALLVLSLTFAAQAQEIHVKDCTFGSGKLEFTPNAALTTELEEEVKGATVYNVKNKMPGLKSKNELAFISKVNQTTIQVNFFELSPRNDLEYKSYLISVFLSGPISVQRPLITFSSSFYQNLAQKGTCQLRYGTLAWGK